MYRFVEIDRQEIILDKKEKYHFIDIKLIYCSTQVTQHSKVSYFNISLIYEKHAVYSCPADPVVRSSWFNILDIDALSISIRARICSDHFKREDYDIKTSVCRLFPNALSIDIQV